MNKTLFLLSFLLLWNTASAQLGGQNAYEFLSLPSSSRITALGGTLITVHDDDVALALHNPAVLDSMMHNQLSFNHNFHLAGISNGYVNYGRILPWYGLTAHAGVQYVDYGTFRLTDEIGSILGEFDAGEMAVVLGVGKQLNERIRAGINIKAISANYESYSSTGIASDLGVYYENPASRFSAALVVQNVGMQLSTFTDNRESLPFDLQIGVSQRLKHLPFRLSITGHNLHRYGVRYDDPDVVVSADPFGNVEQENAFNQGLDNIFRHLIFGGEFLLGRKENLRLRFGYNHLRRQELKVTQFRSLGGFSLGFGLKIYKFRIDYGVGHYHLGGATNHISISTNFSEYRKKI